MSDPKKHSVLEAKNLTVGYRSKKDNVNIASNINFKIRKGNLVGLVGANGIGKSTLIRTLINTQPALNGTVLLNGKPTENISPNELAQQLSVVLTEPLLAKNLSVYELIALGRYPYTNWIGQLTVNDNDVIESAITLVGINAFKQKKCHELSDGQLQKVMIARALAQDTDVIVLDEPTTHLDMYHKAYILKLLKKLTKQTGKTILFSSHEIDLAIQLCDTMLVMQENTVVYNEPRQLIEQGVFDTLFPKDTIIFDTISGSFKVKK